MTVFAVIGLLGFSAPPVLADNDRPNDGEPPAASALASKTAINVSGTYTGKLQGKDVKLTLIQKGNKLSGQFIDSASVFVVDGTVNGSSISGTLKPLKSAVLLRFTGSLSANILSFSAIAGTTSIPMTLSRPAPPKPAPQPSNPPKSNQPKNPLDTKPTQPTNPLDGPAQPVRGPNFSGRFDGTLQGKLAILTLIHRGDALNGTFTVDKAIYNLAGKVTGGSATGTMKHTTTGYEVGFEASRGTASVSFTLLIKDPNNGNITRTKLAMTGAPMSAQPPPDERNVTPPVVPAANSLVGRWEGTLQNNPIALQLQQTGATITGQLKLTGSPYQIAGRANAANNPTSARGTLSHPQSNTTMSFEAQLSNGNLAFVLVAVDQQGQQQRVPLQFTRAKSNPNNPSGPNPPVYPAPTFNGKYTGSFNGMANQMSLSQQGSKVTGRFTEGNRVYPITATAQGNQIRGTMDGRQYGLIFQFQGTLTGGTLNMNVLAKALQTGQTQQLKMSVTRAATTGSPPRPSTRPTPPNTQQPTAPLDRRIVGNWRITISSKVLDLNTAQDIQMVLSADGRYLYGAGSFAYAQDGGKSGSVNSANIEQGRWKTVKGVLYYQTGSSQWQTWGRYSLDGTGRNMIIYLPNGKKVLCER